MTSGASINYGAFAARKGEWKGIAIASLVIGAWAGHLLFALTQAEIFSFMTPVHIAVQSILNVGLFITAHDAIHGTLAPGRRKLNDAFGRAALFLYAAFDWESTARLHHKHHEAPATTDDPDYKDGVNERFWPWIGAFAVRYYGWKNLAMMFLHVGAATIIAQSYWKMLVFFAVPAWASAVQLFYFGVYLPHKTPPGGHYHPHRAVTVDLPEWLSFLTCFHFGYHEEHHDAPATPWWRLPAVRRAVKAAR
ncbi:MAG: fatty acid desaturase [Pseudomonadota bacterium]